jgi:ATP-binding cassette, subfamily B, bacterial MsbA
MIRFKLIRQLWPYVRPYKTKAIIALLLSFVLAAIGGAQVKLVKPIFDTGFSGAGSFKDVLSLAGTLRAFFIFTG